ncbi:hypothetical protein [Spirosoma litoris]
MKYKFTVFACTLFLLGLSCSKKDDTTNNNSSFSDESDEEYPDGRYCARVNYYYSETGTSSTYTLAIDIEDGELEKIYWPNGGWLDHSHFSIADISGGTARFHSFEGVDYRVTIIGRDGECSLSTNAISEDQLIEDAREDKEEYEQQLRDEQEEEEERER